MPRHPHDRLSAPEWPVVGRTRELRAIGASFASGARLATLHGPGGVGKSRLALEWALGRDDTHGPVIGCDVEGLRTGASLVREIADRLDVPLVTGDDAAHRARILASLTARGALTLLVDGAETLDDAARGFLADALAGAPRLRLLVASRHVLGMPGEAVITLGPLDSDASLELLVSRVRTFRPRFSVRTEDERRVLLDLVHRLDGLPLALDLAAARLRVTSPARLLGLLAARLELLAEKGDGRHASLTAALDASWDLLSELDRRALVALARFTGSFALDTAIDVLVPDEADRTLREVRATARLDELARTALLSVREPEEGEDSPRFSFLESVRTYARARSTDVGEDRGAAERFALAVLARGETLLARAAREPAAIRAMGVEEREVETVLSWADETGALVLAVRALVVLSRTRTVRGPPGSYLDVATRYRERIGTVGDALAAEAHAAISSVEIAAGRFREGLDSITAALACADRAKNDELAAYLEARRAVFQYYLGDTDAAMAAFARARARLPAGASDAMVGRIEAARANVLVRDGAIDEAEIACRLALAAAGRAGDRETAARVTGYLAWCRFDRGHLTEARAGLAEASRACAEIGDRRFAEAYAGDVGLVLFEEGALEAAGETLEIAVRAHELRGDRWYEADHTGYLGLVRFAEGRLERAQEILARAAALHERGGYAAGAAYFAAIEAAAAAEAGDVATLAARRARAEELAASGEPKVLDALALLGHASALAPGATPEARATLAAKIGEALASKDTIPRLPAHALRRALDRITAREHELGSADGIVIASDGSSIAHGGATRAIDSAPVRRLLERLLDARTDTPGRPLDVAALFDAGWPGEAASAATQTNRVRVTLSRLRSAGLGPHLAARPEGYLLDPRAPIRVGGPTRDAPEAKRAR